MITKTALGLAALLLLGIAAISPAAYAAGGTISACPTTVNAAVDRNREPDGGAKRKLAPPDPAPA
jgi:hypothetical protein